MQAPLATVPEIVEPVPEAQPQAPLQELNTNISNLDNVLNITEPRLSVVPTDIDMADLPTQKLETLQETRKHASEEPLPPVSFNYL